MGTNVSVALLASFTALAAMLSGCDAERPSVPPGAESATRADPVCGPPRKSHASACGLESPRRRVPGGVAYKLATVAGERFWLVIPDEIAPPSGVVAIPDVPIDVNAGLTIAPARDAADAYCGDFPRCEVTVVDRVAVPSGVMTRWDDSSGTIRDLELTTVDVGLWTVVMLEPDAAHAGRIARALRWTVDEDGYPRVTSADPEVPVHVDWAGLTVRVDAQDEPFVINILPGCHLSTKQPDLGGTDAGPKLEHHGPDTVDGGSWCVDGRYRVDVSFVDRPRLEFLYENLRISSDLR